MSEDNPDREYHECEYCGAEMLYPFIEHHEETCTHAYAIALLDPEDILIGEVGVSKQEYDFILLFAEENDMTFDAAFCHFIRVGMNAINEVLDNGEDHEGESDLRQS